MNIEELLDNANELITSGKPEEGKKLCEIVLKQDLNCEDAWLTLSFAELRLLDYAAAEAAAQKALKIDPFNASALHNLSEAYFFQGNEKKCLECNNEALIINDNEPLLWFGRGKSLFVLDRFEEAEASVGRALELDKNNNNTLVLKENLSFLCQENRIELFRILRFLSTEFYLQNIKAEELYAIVQLIFVEQTKFDQEEFVVPIYNISLLAAKADNNPQFNHEDILISYYLTKPEKRHFWVLDINLIYTIDFFAFFLICAGKLWAISMYYINYLMAYLLGDDDTTRYCLKKLSDFYTIQSDGENDG